MPSTTKILLTVLTTVLATSGALAAGPARAQSVDPVWPTVLSPAPGDLAGGSRPDFVLDTSATEPGHRYEFNVVCSRLGVAGGELVTDGSKTVTFSSVRDLPQSGICTAEIIDRAAFTAKNVGSWHITETGPWQQLGNAKVSDPVFYPLVRDGYLDDVQITWTNYGTRDTHIEIRNSAGVTVHTGTAAAAYLMGTLWLGRDDQGELVPPGNYDIVLTPEGVAESPTTSTHLAVEVKTDVVDVRRSASRLGSASSVRAARHCRATRDADVSRSTTLQCRGGRFARARYRFALPAGARAVRWAVDGTEPAASGNRGRITSSGARSQDRTHYTVSTTVTRWRAYEVRGVALSWTERVRR